MDDTRQKIGHQRDGSRGFSLLEVLLAMSILSFGMLGTGALLAGVIKGNDISQRITTATVLAQDKIEELREQKYRDLPSTSTYTAEDYGSVSYTTDQGTVSYPRFKRATIILADTPTSGMITAVVWVFSRTSSHPVTLRTIIAE